MGLEHPEAQKALARRIIKLVKTIKSLPHQASTYESYLKISRGRVCFSLFRGSLVEYRKILSLLLEKYKMQETVSLKVIENGVQGFIAYALQDLRDGEETILISLMREIDEFYQEVDKSITPQKIYIPASGIFLYSEQVETLPIGNVEFLRLNSGKVREILDVFKDIIYSTDCSEQDKEFTWQKDCEYICEAFENKVCVSMAVTAEPIRAIELAIEEAQKAMEVLRYCSSWLHSREQNIAIGLEDEAGLKRYRSLVISQNHQFCSWGSQVWNNKAVGSSRTFDIDEKMLVVFEKSGSSKLSALTGKKAKELTEIEEVILQAVCWFSRSQRQYEIENELLNLAICLENVFAVQSDDKISNSIAEGTAFVLSDALQERREIKAQIRKLYGVRSRVTHGSASKINEPDVDVLRDIVKRVIRRLVLNADSWESRSDLSSWIEEKKLS